MMADAGESLHATARAYRAGETSVAPVYLSRRVIDGVMRHLVDAMPDEGICKVVGYEATHAGFLYARVTDWFAGESRVTPVTATFTDRGLRAIEIARRDRYPDRDTRPWELGVAHSHPFGHEPRFSGTDIDTFTQPPYGVDNVHLLADPTIGALLVYIGVRDENPSTGRATVRLTTVPWVAYEPADAR